MFAAYNLSVQKTRWDVQETPNFGQVRIFNIDVSRFVYYQTPVARLAVSPLRLKIVSGEQRIRLTNTGGSVTWIAPFNYMLECANGASVRSMNNVGENCEYWTQFSVN